jgi:2-polyprenyl-6-methoxyphenol hydroxylase-like FAD-dependent oxidoreductase
MPTLKPITIVGGGLAGLTLGLGLRRKGIPVTVWEAGHYPRHRVCGEFVSGRGQDVLARLGLLEAFRRAGAVPARTAAFFLDRAASPVRPLPTPALCLSRCAMDALLADRFREAGGELRENARWREEAFGEGIVRTTGRRLQPGEPDQRWFGLKIHARNVPLVADLEMHGAPSGYVGFCRLGDGEVNICALLRHGGADEREAGAPASCRLTPLEPPKPATCRRSGLSALAEACGPGTPLLERLEAAVLDQGSFCSVAGISLRPHRAVSRSECCLGDALTMIPPVTGNGMSMAFEAAEMAVAPLAAYSRGESTWSQARQSVAAACDRAFAQRLAWARWLQWMMFSPLLRGWRSSLALHSNLLWHIMFTRTR